MPSYNSIVRAFASLGHDLGQQHTEQPEFNNEGKVDQNAEQCHDKRGNRRVEFSRQLVLDGFLLEKYSPLAQPRLIVNLHMVPTQISLIFMNALDSRVCTSINVLEEKTLDLSVGTPFNLKNERIKAWKKKM
uniref:Uncharacterized protein n=1 Tax=Tanacetum cinerariifolium TaxID=118510 RepID=A0A6L2M5Z7_TANCI|nr:hypothetical protein [Tanacetum cinerariifolium]